MNIPEIVTNIVEYVKANWIAIGVIYLAFHTFLKAIRDAFDKTPETDDNIFERIVTILGKATKYFITGKRAS